MATTDTKSQQVDEAASEAFVGKVFGDTVGAAVVGLATIGDRLGLFRELAAGGPATSEELARRANINERYAREWLAAMASAGYLRWDPVGGRFVLPAAHIPALVQEGGPHFLAGVQQELMGCFAVIDQLTDAFQTGGGVSLASYPDSMFSGIDRFTAGWFENLLLQQWLPAVPGVLQKLENGCRMADVGTGHGRALIRLANAFPKSEFVGYDAHGPSVDRAAASVRDARVERNAIVRHLDVVAGLPEQYDVVTTFDVIHDAVDPVGLLRSIRQGLKADGSYLCLEINEANALGTEPNPIGALLYGFSVLLCMTTSLAEGGAGLGTLGVGEKQLREMAAEAGFGSVQIVPLENPFNTLYELRP